MNTMLALMGVLLCLSADAATDVRHGSWAAEVDGNQLQVTLFARERHDVMSVDVALSALCGLSAEDVASGAANVQFQLRRPAGTIVFDGRFSDGAGAGQFRFMPSETLGAEGFTDEQMLMFAAHGFSPREIERLRNHVIIGRSRPRSRATSTARS